VDDRLGKLELLELDLAARRGQRVAGAGVLQADARGDVAGEDGVDVFPVVGVHLQDPTHALLGAAGGVDDLRALLERARVHPEVRELAHVRVGHDLEGQGGERLGVGRLALDLLVALHGDAGDRGQVDRAGQVVDDGVEQRLHALVLEGGAVEDRDDLVGDRAGADGGAQVLDRDLLLADVLLEDVLVERRENVDQLRPVLLGLVGEVVGDLADLPLGAQVFLQPHQRLHGDEVDDALVVALGPDRQLEDGRVGTQPVFDGLERGEEVGTQPVHLVDEAHAGDAVLVCLLPYRLGLGLDTGDTVEHRDGTVEDAQRPLDLDREVDVAGRVDDVDLVVAPEGGRRGRCDRDAALLLLDHPVHGGGALVDLTDLVGPARVIEDALGRCRLARVDVGHDADVAGLVEGVGALWHRFESLRRHRRRPSDWHVGVRPGRQREQTRGSLPPVTGGTTSGSGRRPCSTQPSCACLPCA
jgi:hypothetical protein